MEEECVETKAALKTRFATMKSSTETTTTITSFPGELFCVGTGNKGVLPGATAGDEFSVDEFFDLPAEEEMEGPLSNVEEEEEEEKDSSALSGFSHELLLLDEDGNSVSSSAAAAAANPGHDLHFPVDNMKELELWSHLMDDSVSEPSPANRLPKTGFQAMNRTKLDNKLAGYITQRIPGAVPVRPRSKLPRKNRLNVCSGRSAASARSALVGMNLVHDIGQMLHFPETVQKKQTSKTAPEEGGGGMPPGWQCAHCQVQKTPLRRAGPMGPKTLCNACGVQFRKGRLFPEYRPACSPTFSKGVHSNSHRRVIEMRRKNEMVEPVSRSGPVHVGMLRGML